MRKMPMSHPYTIWTSSGYQKSQNIWRKSTAEMDFSKHKTLKQIEIDFSMTTQEPVELVKATEVVIIIVLTLIQITVCPTAVEVSLKVPV